MGLKFVYISGPMSSSGNYLDNIRRAVRAAEELKAEGFMPFVPHLSAIWQLISPHCEYDYWLPMDLAWVERCDAVLRLPGASVGADMEVAHAVQIGRPVFQTVEGLVRARRER